MRAHRFGRHDQRRQWAGDCLSGRLSPWQGFDGAARTRAAGAWPRPRHQCAHPLPLRGTPEPPGRGPGAGL